MANNERVIDINLLARCVQSLAKASGMSKEDAFVLVWTGIAENIKKEVLAKLK